MAKHIVCLTFDFDAMSGFIARGMTSPTPVSRGEFGADVATPRLLALLKKYRIATSWYIPGHTLETYPARCREVFAAGHEIGHHGWTHVPPALLTRDKEEEGLTRANEQIKKLTGSYARGYRSPSWDLSPHSIELLLKHGFEYDSSMMGDDYTPYRVRQGDVIELEKPAVFGKTTRLIEMPISWTLDDYPHFEFIRTKDWILPGLMNYNLVLENWINDFLYMKKILKWGVITYTFHPFVIGRAGRMLMLEKLIKKLKAEGAVFMTLEQAVAEYDKRAPFKK
ncbi:MAG TPA: polysaccharide deacetylase [Burkholderiales bacterium]|jgi:peptidoglycan/xylan/chitin deacetylase (PgdA/CDA1 family)|nr:polysaccharide deacetylase [Burkholderiales bacterium]HWP88392.1 polysaccharide deacetylase [Burkholderiales bacterium]